MENDLHACAQLLARARLGRIGVPGPWGSSGLVTGADHLNLTLVQRKTGSGKRRKRISQNARGSGIAPQSVYTDLSAIAQVGGTEALLQISSSS